MKKLLLSAAIVPLFSFTAYAADLPNTKGPPAFAPPPPPVFSWTGLYVGAQVGYEWGTSDPTIVSNPTNTYLASLNNYSDQGVVGGLHAGYNYQVSQFVFGIEGDVDGSSYNGSSVTGPSFTCSPPCTYNSRSNVQGSIRGRIGWAWDRVLIYGTGGAAFASIQNSLSIAGLTDSQTFGRVGWTAGGGVEYALDPNWSVRVEYCYTDFGAYDLDLINIVAGVLSVRELERDNRVEAGVSYKFDMFAPPAPVVAKY